MTTVLGIDPGQSHTGMMVVVDGHLRDHTTLERNDAPLGVWLHRHRSVVNTYASVGMGNPVLAVEDVTTPNVYHGGKRQVLNPTSAIETAKVMGCVVGVAHSLGLRVVIVPPGGHGSAPAACYPAELIGAREGPALSGRLRHERSAWDVAASAVAMLGRGAA